MSVAQVRVGEVFCTFCGKWTPEKTATYFPAIGAHACSECDDLRENGPDGRFMEAVNEYASTCDGPCMELTSHQEMAMDAVTQLGYCCACQKIPWVKELLERNGIG